MHLSTAARLYTIHMAPASIMHCISQTNRQAELLISPLIQFRLAITTSAIPSTAPATPNPGDPWEGGWSVDEGSVVVRVWGDMKAGCCAGIKQIHRKAREGRKDNVASALRSLRCIILSKLYFNSHGRHRQHPATSEATARPHHSQSMLNACAEMKQAGIISISLLTTDKHR